MKLGGGGGRGRGDGRRNKCNNVIREARINDNKGLRDSHCYGDTHGLSTILLRRGGHFSISTSDLI